MRTLHVLTVATALIVTPAFAGDSATKPTTPAKSQPPSEKKPMSLHDLSANRLDGKAEKLSDFQGKVLVVVNTASECGYTPQYAGLEKLFQDYKDKGVVVLGFPSNDFGGQEPGSSEDIKKFCELRFKVSFPMFEKVKTKGDGQSPVYAFLAKNHDAPKWNFHKYVVGKDGQVKAGFPSKVTPESDELRKAVDAALAQP
ncbi:MULTISPECIES: glutathione peroxidase [Myxococcus]|uniref:Glutathione peroxidase n=1 Tax=Myxococcus llanfairpwllgwyngyllgogerychwyrndrobwllllantysiliogogogochensis TaxID=2590453 RepID=A0A540X3G5_9BACT|nr:MULTISPECIES: glutathione peroxidase [Myxococcus]NTX04363.1 glutathione peroxidase [Myxococcus sp. CA040A]TQF15770.1 glutathione peroxidase [Myxococcus llanfairpwllgwyngyllgogerychwyrndrobwllllantysiliogogogochensis]